jgi:L-amino acid N-acyltransferase YncA
MHGVSIRTVRDSDREQVIAIFNHYVTTGFAAYPDTPVPPGFFHLLRDGAHAFLVAERNGAVVGFCLLKPFLPFSTFSRTAMVSTFIDSAHRHSGCGSVLLEAVTREAQNKGIAVLLASISSRNPDSLAFHGHHGFCECGRLHGAGLKFGEPFDVVWMEKDVSRIPSHHDR